MKKLPKTIYVAWEWDGQSLIAYESLKDCVDSDEDSTLIGEYTLGSKKKYTFKVTEA